MLLFTDRFGRRADMFAVSAADLTAEGTTNLHITKYIPLWGCPRSVLWDNGLQFFLKLSYVVFEISGFRTVVPSSYHPNGSCGVERVELGVTEMMAEIVSERQDDWEAQLPHVEFEYVNSVSAATGISLNEVDMGGFLRFYLEVFEYAGVAGRQRPPSALV